MSISTGERRRAELALEGRASAELCDLQARVWPSVADRIREARIRIGLSENEIALRLGITVPAYRDLELHDDEAFTVMSLKELVDLGRVLTVHPRVLLLGTDGERAQQMVTFNDVTACLAERVESGLTVDQLGDLIGWDIKTVLNDPKSLWDFSVEALYDICKKVDLDWVAALPDAVEL